MGSRRETRTDDDAGPPLAIHGRGASWSPANRFEALALEPDSRIPRMKIGRSGRRNISAISPARSSRITTVRMSDLKRASILIAAASTAAFIVMRGRRTSISAFPPGSISRAGSWSRKTRRELLAAELSSPKLEAADARDERRDRSLSAGRTQTADHPTLPRSAGAVSQSSRDHHEEPSGDARHRFARRTGRSTRRRQSIFRSPRSIRICSASSNRALPRRARGSRRSRQLLRAREFRSA